MRDRWRDARYRFGESVEPDLGAVLVAPLLPEEAMLLRLTRLHPGQTLTTQRNEENKQQSKTESRDYIETAT